MVRYHADEHSSIYEEVKNAYPRVGDTGLKTLAAIFTNKIMDLQALGKDIMADELVSDIQGKMPLRWLRRKYSLPIHEVVVKQSEGL